jgi:hypothetical protein
VIRHQYLLEPDKHDDEVASLSAHYHGTVD